MVSSKTKQANFSLPAELLEDLRRQVPKGEQSKIVAEALRKELMKLRFRHAVDNALGSWNQEEHPELKEGTEIFLRRMRYSSRRESQKS